MKKSNNPDNTSVLAQQSRVLQKQNEMMISLLGRLAFEPKQIREIVESNKKESLRQKYVNGYNALDGFRTLSEIASIIGVTEGTLSPILVQWAEKGIIYEVEKSGGKFYKNLYPI